MLEDKSQGKYPTGKVNDMTTKLHRAAAEARHGRLAAEDEHASHLCNNAECYEPSHMWLELGPVNRSRRLCHLCMALGVLDWKDLCCHEPPCLNVGLPEPPLEVTPFRYQLRILVDAAAAAAAVVIVDVVRSCISLLMMHRSTCTDCSLIIHFFLCTIKI